MENSDQFRFVSLLALELENGDISLPSLPDVVLKIRKLLESDTCDFERVSQAVSVDPVLVSRLFVYSNSAVKKGYSGTAILTKIKPLDVRFDLGKEEHDQEVGVWPLQSLDLLVRHARFVHGRSPQYPAAWPSLRDSEAPK